MITPPPFPILESFGHGLRMLWAHRRLFGILSFFPFLVTLATIVGMRFAGADVAMFWLPIIQMPSTFVIGLQCALILRFIVLHEYPLMMDSEEKALRNRAVMQATVVYTAINYFVTGAYAGLLKLRAWLMVSPTEAAPYAPLAVIMLVALMWSIRWFWLHVPVALDWPVSAFYLRLGKWAGSMRVFALFALCSLAVNFVTGFVRILLAAIADMSGGKSGGFLAAFDDSAIAAATVLLAVLFATCTAVAVKIMASTKTKDIEA